MYDTKHSLIIGVQRRGRLDYNNQCYCSECSIVYKKDDIGEFCPVCHKHLRKNARNHGIGAKKRIFERSI
jgi:Zn finger protein HypA/HybF involved in hydrogenase expression